MLSWDSPILWELKISFKTDSYNFEVSVIKVALLLCFLFNRGTRLKRALEIHPISARLLTNFQCYLFHVNPGMCVLPRVSKGF